MKMMEPRRLVAPTQPVVPLDEFKAHFREDFSHEDAVLAGYLDAATNLIDGWNGELGKALLTQTWQFDYDDFPTCRRLPLPFGPVQ